MQHCTACHSEGVAEDSAIIILLPWLFGTSAGHRAKAKYNGRMILPIGTSINNPSGPGKPALEHIFQNAITGKILINADMNSIITIISIGPIAQFGTADSRGCMLVSFNLINVWLFSLVASKAVSRDDSRREREWSGNHEQSGDEHGAIYLN